MYADSAYRSAEAEAMLAQKQVTSHIHERAYCNRPLNRSEQMVRLKLLLRTGV